MSPKHRSHGEGSISKQPNGRWRGEIMLGYKPDGSRNRRRVYAATRREVIDKLAELRKLHAAGQPIASSRQTVAEYLSYWLERVAMPSVFARTYAGYESIVRRHIIPGLGRHRLDRLMPVHVQEFQAGLLATLSPLSVRHVRACLHGALQSAVDLRILPFNPCDGVKGPRVGKSQSKALTPGQAVRFYHAATADEELGAFWIVAVTTGMREGELYALRWEDIDLGSPVIRVRRAFSRVPGIGRMEKAPKDDEGRMIPLLAVAVEALERHRCRQVGLRAKADGDWHEQGLVFTTCTGGPLREWAIHERFHALLVSAGLPRIRPYDLRHSAASLYLALGVPGKDVSALLGHSTIKLTLDTYGHSFLAIQPDALMRLNDLLTSDSPSIPP